MPHKLVIDNLDDDEAVHISEILNSYKSNMIVKKIDAMAEGFRSGNKGTTEWYDSHIAWHDSILEKVKWSKQ